MKQLKVVYLDGTNVTRAGVVALKKASPKLEIHAFDMVFSKEAKTPLLMEMKVEYKAGTNHAIEITLVNKDSKMIECLKSELPWHDCYSMTLLLVKSDVLKEQLKPRIPPIGTPPIEDSVRWW